MVCSPRWVNIARTSWRWRSWSSATRKHKLANDILVPPLGAGMMQPAPSDRIEIGVQALHFKLEQGHPVRDGPPIAGAAERLDAPTDVGEARGTDHFARTLDSVRHMGGQRSVGIADGLPQHQRIAVVDAAE